MKKAKKGEICEYCVVKRKGHSEEFDEKKVYGSCYAACINAQIEHVKAEKISAKVTKEIKTWARKKKAVDSSEIFKKIAYFMKKHNKDAAFMYETHRDIA